MQRSCVSDTFSFIVRNRRVRIRTSRKKILCKKTSANPSSCRFCMKSCEGVHAYVNIFTQTATRRCSRESLYKWIAKHGVLGYKYDWLRASTSMMQTGQVEGTLVQVSSWRQLRGENEGKKRRNLRRSSATSTRLMRCRRNGGFANEYANRVLLL